MPKSKYKAERKTARTQKRQAKRAAKARAERRFKREKPRNLRQAVPMLSLFSLARRSLFETLSGTGRRERKFTAAAHRASGRSRKAA